MHSVHDEKLMFGLLVHVFALASDIRNFVNIQVTVIIKQSLENLG